MPHGPLSLTDNKNMKRLTTMAFFKKQKQKINGKWYPQAVTVGKPVTTDMVAKRLAEVSTVSPGDTYAVLKNLGPVLALFMEQGLTVKLDGVGTLYYTAVTNGQGVDTEEEVSANQITGVRVRFIPETRRSSSGKVTTRSLVSGDVYWEELPGTPKPATPDTPDAGGEDVLG